MKTLGVVRVLALSLRYYPMPPRLIEKKTIGHEPPIGPFGERRMIVCAHQFQMIE